MDKLQIITNKIQPAKVEFNYKAIDEQLDVVLKRYKGLVFTEDTATDCKKTIAELRKGQKAVDDFRKKTKKMLTQSVTDFEDDCKYLYKKFDTVIYPLKEQADTFEQQRKEEKKQKVSNLIEEVKETFSLNEKYGSQLTIEDKYLNASETMSKVKEHLYVRANDLRELQKKEQADIDLVRRTVENNNNTNDLNLLEDNYLRLLAYEDAATIVAKIYEDSSKLLKAQEEERLRIAEQEAERKTKEEEERLLQEQYEMAADMAVEEADRTVYVEIPDESELLEEAPLITKTFKVTGRPEQIKDLETFLNAIFETYEEV
jgi:hypothetical protein